MALESQGRNLFNMALDAMLIANDQGRYVEVNPAACKLLNCDQDQIIGRTIADFCVLRPGVDLHQQWRMFLAQGHMQGEIALRVGNGEERIVEYAATANVSPHFHLSILRDITERKQAEALKEHLNQMLAQQVKERTEELRVVQTQLAHEHSLLDNILSNINGVVWSIDLPTMTTRYVNSAVETLYGYSKEAFLNATDLWRCLIYPADQPKIEQFLGQLSGQEHFDLEYRITRADGEVRWVRDRSRVVYDLEGKPVRLDSVATDITEQKQLEEALRLSESRLRAIFQQAALGINQASLEGHFLQANQAYCDMLGYSEAELLQLRYQDIAHPDERQETEAALAKLYAEEVSSVTLEKRYFHKDGSVRWTNLVLSILRDGDGQAISDIAIVQDISDRKQIEQALEEERSLFIDGPTVVIRWGPTDEWPVEYVSPNVQAQLGYEPSDLVEGRVAFASLIHPDDIDKVQAEVSAAVVAQTPFLATEYRLRHANGDYRWIDEFTRIIYGTDGTVVRFLGYVQDITERKQTALALQESEATKQAMLSAIPDLLMRIDRYGLRYDFISGGEITLYGDVDTQRPQSVYEMLPQALADQRLHFIRQALDTGERQIYEYTITVDGHPYYEEARIVPLEGDKALVMVRDVSDRVAAEKALRESQQRFQAIFDQMYQFIGLLTPEGILLEANQTALAFGGFSREDVVNRPAWETGWWDVSPETQDQLKQAIAAAGRGEFVRYEVAIQGANQQMMTIDFSLRPVLDDQGQVVLLIPEGRDITQRKHMEEELERTKVFLEQTNSVARVGGWEVDLQQNLVHWTPTTREIHEVDADFEPTLATALSFYPSGANRQRMAAAIENARLTGQPWDEKLQVVTAKGNLRWVRSLGQAEFVDGTCTRLYGAFQDIDAQMRAEMQLQELTQQLQQANGELSRVATTDALTQVANRRYFDQVFMQEWAQAQRATTSLALIMCDVDYFKPYNDHYGHPAGDRCLQQVAQLLKDHIQRPGDVLARYGGEEFVVLLPKTTLVGAMAVATRIQQQFAQARLPHGFSSVADHITLSFGIACCVPLQEKLPSELLAAADTALYQAKLAGRNRYCIIINDRPDAPNLPRG
ncbi:MULTISPECIES: PAS domain S-box protein [Cyanophyceae]|uniref:PAS domain S-box protein n=1 Tax=Leptolyngbya subtilissima DQ-A4 TaxID=2933933 RepID=A0ABV0K419_9CYAN|nr:PAS domain S-box protein [Nodosilinea sp. FACHB-141]MBD2113521.1 PAS domain S-box protein [Nodosilinea sp. FACHB-141]